MRNVPHNTRLMSAPTLNPLEQSASTFITLTQYLKQKELDDEISEVICAVASACVDISKELSRLPIHNARNSVKTDSINVQGEVQKGMDIIANRIFLNEVSHTVAALASEEEEGVIYGKPNSDMPNSGNMQKTEMKYEIAFDPLDGSSNLDVSVPTGTIFGISPHTADKPFSSSGRAIIAAGYTVYSSSIELVISLGLSGSKGAAGFTLDPTLLLNNSTEKAACFVLSRPNLICPPNGPYYSLNDGREPDWPEGLRKWIYDAKRGLTPSGTIFSARYICSLCADVHRTLIKGGWAGNPRPHLRLLYEAAPLAHVAEACGGRGSNGVKNLLDIKPAKLHERVPVFIGSKNDVKELEEYGDVQQGISTYGN